MRSTAQFKGQSLPRRLGFAAAGLRLVARREKSFRVQLGLGASALGACLWLRPGLVWTALILLAGLLVLALEMVNAALEYAIDQLHPQIAPEIGAAKDAAAGAVLVASLGALGIAGLMLASCLS